MSSNNNNNNNALPTGGDQASSSRNKKRRAPPRRTPSGAFLRKPVPSPSRETSSVGDPLSSSSSHTPSLLQPGAVDDYSSSPQQRPNNYSSIIPSQSPDDGDNHNPSFRGRGSTDPSNTNGNNNNSNNRSQQSAIAATTATTTTTTLNRHLSLLDLVAIGVGGTIGSGLFVLTGLVAHSYAGPSAVLSWFVSGLTALLSGCCYAELSSRIPIAGSSYAYAYVSMGELPAVLAAACLSMEYIAASAAVARSWGDKVVDYLVAIYSSTPGHEEEEQQQQQQHWIEDCLFVGQAFNPLAMLISVGVVLLLLAGVKESKCATKCITGLKVAVAAFMVVAGFYHVQPSKNWTPFFPMGVGGVFRGATGTFFGYLGYDQVCCLAEEAHDPKRNLPRAVLLVLASVATLYMLATLALTGMQPYEDISPVSGFPSAFRAVVGDGSNSNNWASNITALGEIVTLPIVIVVALMAQPRLMYGMAVDGLLPAMFQQVDEHGNLVNGTLVAGIIMILVATFIKFESLNDMISGAVLLALSMTDSAVILLWHCDDADTSSNISSPSLLSSPSLGDSIRSSSSSIHSFAPSFSMSLSNRLMLGFHFAALVAGIALGRFAEHGCGQVVGLVAVAVDIFCCYALWSWCPRSSVFGGQRHDHYHQDDLKIENDEGYFRCPFVPALPCCAIFVNWYLIAQLGFKGVSMLLAYLMVVTMYYFGYAAKHSVGNNTGWQVAQTPPPPAAAAAGAMISGNTAPDSFDVPKEGQDDHHHHHRRQSPNESTPLT